MISVDEFKSNSGGHKYNFLTVDPEHRCVLDVLPSWYENDFSRYFSQFPNTNEVKYFVCDMNPHFRNVAKTCFPNAKIVADKFHAVRQVNWALERVRKSEQEKLPERLRKYFKKSRLLLLKPMEKLKESEIDKLAQILEIAPRLADAYRMGNDFLSIIYCNSSAEGREMLARWLFAVEDMGLPEFVDCVRAYRNWFQEILHAIDTPWFNGYIEGCNNKNKVLKRVCFGMRNFNNFRKRSLFCNI